MRKVLITGGAGFLGMNLANYLLNKGYYVYSVDFANFFGRDKYINEKYRDNISLIYMDLNNAKLVRNLPLNIDYVVHLAALPHVDYSRFYPQKTLYNNMTSLINILDYVVENRVEMIFASSVETYGGTNDQTYSEHNKLCPLSIYGYTKQAGEELIRYYINKYKIECTIVRLTNLYGPMQLPDRVIPRNICRLINNNSIDLTQNFYRDFLYVEDACAMITTLLEKDKSGCIYNLSTGNACSIQNVLSQIMSFFKNTDIEINTCDFLNETRGKYLKIDNEKIRAICNYQIELKDGIVQTVEWYLSNLEWVKQFEKYYIKLRNDESFIIDCDNLGKRINI